MATWAKIKENWSGVFWGFLMAIIMYYVNPKYSECRELIKAIPQLSTCVFGFLLTLLGIILQGSGPVIERMKSSTILFNRFIGYNKRIVLLSFFISIVAFVFGYIDFSWAKECMASFCASSVVFVKKLFISLLTWSCVWLIVDMITFINLFYLLIKAPK